MDFTIKTHSTFENIYNVKANSLQEAIAIVMNSDNPPDFYQKHLGEKIVDHYQKLTPRDELIKEEYF